MMPMISVVAIVYFPPGEQGELRRRGFRESVRSWRMSLVYPPSRDLLRLLVVNDGPAFSKWPEWSFETQEALGHPRSGAGASLNMGLKRAFESSPLVLSIPDDCMASQYVDLVPWAKLLMENETIGAVHLAPYPGCTGTIQPLKGGSWGVVLNRHNLAAGLRACLYHKRFFDAYGWFEENISAWESERLFNEHFCQSTGPESVLALPLPWREGIGAEVRLGQVNPCTNL